MYTDQIVKIYFTLLFSLIGFVTQAQSQSRTQILTTNFFCEINAGVGSIVLKAPSGSATRFTPREAQNLVNAKILQLAQLIVKAKQSISRNINVARNRRKIRALKSEISFWRTTIPEIKACVGSGAVAKTPTPTPKPTAKPTPVSGGGSNGGISISNFSLLVGGSIIAKDGQFLGVFSANPYNTTSIANQYGTYGSDYSSSSIFNDYGTYGSDYSSQSPWNEYTSTPPIIFMDGEGVAYLTANRFLSPRVDPYVLLSWLGRSR